MPLKACTVIVHDLNETAHAVDVTAGTLYEARVFSDKDAVIARCYADADLCKTFECLSVEQLTGELREKIHAFAFRIAEHPVEIIAGVPETLRHLAARKHHLILMTKGAPAEQISKVERSGLKNYFAAVEVVGEKNARAYHAVAEKYALDTDVTWMIGNSPRSDVNPALEAGLHAVFVPHDMTWVLEHEELAAPIKAGQHLLKLDRFSDLTSHF